MRKKRKLLIADHSVYLCQLLAACLQEKFEIKYCSTGIEAIALLQAFHPDALLLDLELPQKDGLSVMENAKAHLPPIVLCTTSMLNPYISMVASHLGAGYIVQKPYDVSETAARITDMAENWNTPLPAVLPPHLDIVPHLRRLNVPSHLDGFLYLRIGIPEFAKDPTQRLGKELFLIIASQCGGSSALIESAIRTAIRTAWSRRDDAVWAEYFPPDASGQIPCPSNKAFIARLAQLLSLS